MMIVDSIYLYRIGQKTDIREWELNPIIVFIHLHFGIIAVLVWKIFFSLLVFGILYHLSKQKPKFYYYFLLAFTFTAYFILFINYMVGVFYYDALCLKV